MTKQSLRDKVTSTDKSVDKENEVVNNTSSPKTHIDPKKTNIIEQNERRRQLHTTP